MMLQWPQNEPCKRVTLSIVPGESCGLQTPAILMARLLFHVVGINHNVAVLCWIRELSSVAECSITFYIVLIMSDVCGGERALHAFITGSEVYEETTGQGVGLGDRRLH